VDESGMIGIQIGKHDRLEMVAVQASPCAPPSPCNSNCLSGRIILNLKPANCFSLDHQ
jgi:hypothetical protein